MKLKNLLIYFLLLIIIIISINNFILNNKYKNIELKFLDLNNSLKTQSKYYKSKILDLNNKNIDNLIKKYIINDLSEINYISYKEKKLIYDNIIKYSSEYNINPLILYSVIYTESRFKSNIEHNPVFIKSLNKSIQAVGLGGVVWEFWKDDLIKNNIAETRSELFFIENNINASAFILKKYFEMNKLPKAKSQWESALMRYYGTQYSNYQNLIYIKMSKFLIFKF